MTKKKKAMTVMSNKIWQLYDVNATIHVCVCVFMATGAQKRTRRPLSLHERIFQIKLAPLIAIRNIFLTNCKNYRNKKKNTQWKTAHNKSENRIEYCFESDIIDIIIIEWNNTHIDEKTSKNKVTKGMWFGLFFKMSWPLVDSMRKNWLNS